MSVSFRSVGSDAEVVVDERVNVGVFVDNFGHGLACAMTGLAVDADEFGSVARVGCLKRGGVFERVSRHYAVVDGTLGGGGHAYEVCRRLSSSGRFIGIDQDGDAIEAAARKLSGFG